MILLETAASRIATATSDYGLACHPELSLRESTARVRLINSVLSPLSLPTELRDFWTWWAPELFSRPVLDGFLTGDEAVDLRQSMIDIGYPEMLLPIARFGKGLVWIELQSKDHPGSRVFYGGYADPELRLWAIGVSGLLELVAETIESGGVITWAADQHRLNPAAFHSALNGQLAKVTDSATEFKRIPIADASQWPAHWKASSSR